MASCYPYRVPDETEVCDRIRILYDLATDGMSSPRVQAMAQRIFRNALASCGSFSSIDQPAVRDVMCSQQWVDRILALECLKAAQAMPYVSAPEGEEWVQCADYTSEYGGECKALTVLFCALARLCGLRAEPYWITQTGQNINHVTGRVALDGHWFWADASIKGAMLGESPYEAEARLGSDHVGITGVTSGTPPAAQVVLPSGEDTSWREWHSLWNGWPLRWWKSHSLAAR